MEKKAKMVLVSGATGQQGGAVAGELPAGGFKVRAMMRKPQSERAQALARLGAEVVQADFDDSQSLERVLAGAWGTFAMQNTWEAGVEREEEQGKRFAELARKAGVQHFVYTSVGSAHRRTGIPHFDNKWRIEETVRRLGFPSYTIVRPVFFMENFLSPWFKPAIDQGTLSVGIRPETRLQMIALRDIGKHGLRAFEKPAELGGRSIDLAGDELTMPETAKVIGRATGRTVAFEPTPIQEVRKFSEDYAIMLEWFDRVGYDVDIQRLSEESGIRPTKLEEWAAGAPWT